MQWLPIESAPRDGRPIWARGYNYGKPEKGEHRCWAWWDGKEWKDAMADGQGTLTHLVEWLAA